MYLVHALKKRGLKLLVLLFSCLFLITPFVNSQNKSDKLTEAEAREFMQEFLWFCMYDYKTYEEPDKELFRFLSAAVVSAAALSADFLFWPLLIVPSFRRSCALSSFKSFYSIPIST